MNSINHCIANTSDYGSKCAKKKTADRNDRRQ